MKLNLEKYIAKRNKFLINNKFEIIKKNNDNFHVVIYYLDKNKIEIVIRKLNNSYGWNYDLKIKFSNDVLSVGSSNDNCKILELYTKFDVNFIENKELFFIPKHIIQTNKICSKNLDHYNTVMSIIERNPNYDYIFFDDLDSRKFIKENFIVNLIDQNEKSENEDSDVLKAYDLLKCGALKADLFRYCYLYVIGGIYLDSKISSIIELDNIIDQDDKFIICSDDAKDSLYNGIMIMEKNSVNLLNMIKEMISNIFLKEYHKDIHEPTGNKLYYKYFSNYEVKLNKKKNSVYLKNDLAFLCDYVNYYKKDYEDFRVNYVNRNYYYHYCFYLNNLIFKFSNDIKDNIFVIFHLKENIYVLKNNANKGWDQHFNIDIYDLTLGTTKSVKINKNSDSEVVFSF